MCIHYVQYKCYQVICVALRTKIAAICQSFIVKGSVLIQLSLLLYFSWHFNTINTKAQSKQYTIVIVHLYNATTTIILYNS